MYEFCYLNNFFLILYVILFVFIFIFHLFFIFFKFENISLKNTSINKISLIAIPSLDVKKLFFNTECDCQKQQEMRTNFYCKPFFFSIFNGSTLRGKYYSLVFFTFFLKHFQDFKEGRRRKGKNKSLRLRSSFPLISVVCSLSSFDLEVVKMIHLFR